MPPIPILNVILGGPSLATVFATPPTAINASPQSALQFLLQFDFDRDAPKIYATDAAFPTSAWDNVSARSADLHVFRAHNGRLIVFHGTADPIFSINDTIAWWNEVDRGNGGKASGFVRLFPVPGMNHCLGGDATDQFDVLAPLVAWVEHNKAPEQIMAAADPMSSWPKRTRPLCPYPQIARYRGTGDVDIAASFECRR
jgi:feruloyl esterase